ncbi:ATP-grasp domain-containing protein [Candidatus Binatia bacterium]|nr:ATP-grasp domain-containing protein [Candidatus Binatia bacterium]
MHSGLHGQQGIRALPPSARADVTPALVRRIAIVNRGEAALRCMRTVRVLRNHGRSDLRAIALYTAPDRDAPFVRQADDAIQLAARSTPVASYLDHDAVFDALRAADADTIWPGWGFLSEDPRFADRARREGFTFLGPTGDAMRLLGDKIAAKLLAKSVGVPVTPWSGRAIGDAASARRVAAELGMPIMIKAAAGGGGRGIRKVGCYGDLAASLRSARSEAKLTCGDARVLLERCVVGGRHIEVQIVGDLHGNVRALGCRDCSVQRHHQKIVEEAPPPDLAADQRACIEDAAVRIATAARYSGVGTAEFLVRGDELYFLEMNPRLQVEHGITEALTGIDLVELQIRVARGEDLSALPVAERGAALEVRICAEDPEDDFVPAPGRVARFDPAQGPGVRVDSGVAVGTTISADFDSLIAKIITTGHTRAEAHARMCAVLESSEIVVAGGTTNKSYLLGLLRSPALVAGAVDTGWLERTPRAPVAADDAGNALVAACAILHDAQRERAREAFFATGRFAASGIPRAIAEPVELVYRGQSHRAEVANVGPGQYRVELGATATIVRWERCDAHVGRLVDDRGSQRLLFDLSETTLRLEIDDVAHRFLCTADGEVRAEFPARVVAVQVEPGQRVGGGDALVVIEAMKVETTLRAPTAGVVARVDVRVGQQLRKGDLVVRLEVGAGDAAAANRPTAPQSRARMDAPSATFRQCDQLRHVLLGFASDAHRLAELLAWLDAPQPRRRSATAAREHAALGSLVVLFADQERALSREPGWSDDGALLASPFERLRAWIAALRHGGADDPSLLPLLRAALRHDDAADLAPGAQLERALLRLLSTRHERDSRQRLVAALLRRLIRLPCAQRLLRRDPEVRRALATLGELRSAVGSAVAEAAVGLLQAIFEEPALRRRVGPKRFVTVDDRWLTRELRRLADFTLEKLPTLASVHCYRARHRTVTFDQRIVVFARADGGSAAKPPARQPLAALKLALNRATRALRRAIEETGADAAPQWNTITVDVLPAIELDRATCDRLVRVVGPLTARLGIERVVLRLRAVDRRTGRCTRVDLVARDPAGLGIEAHFRPSTWARVRPIGEHERRVAAARQRDVFDPHAIALARGGSFQELELDPRARRGDVLRAVERPPGGHPSSVVVGLLRTPTAEVPEGLERVLVISDPARSMGALAVPECRRIVAAIDLAERRRVPVEWLPISSGARIAMDSGTENLDATAAVARRIIRFTQGGGVVHVIVSGVNVGAQSYWNALSTMLLHTKGALVMTTAGSMVLTGRAALEASGAVAAEDEVAIGGLERIAAPNGAAQYCAASLRDAFDVLARHYSYTYVVPGERWPRRRATTDPVDRDVTRFPYRGDSSDGFAEIGDLFDDAKNPGRRRPFSMRAVMAAVVDQDGGNLERWHTWRGAETAIVWDARLGGIAVCLIGIESRSLARSGDLPVDGPSSWTGGTLFSLSSRKIARAINSASGNRPVVVLANLSGFDGSPESLRSLQLENGAEIARAVVNVASPLLFLVVSRYHGGAYVVFSRRLSDRVRVGALAGSYASVIGGSAAAKVVFTRETRQRAARDPEVVSAARALEQHGGNEGRAVFEGALQRAIERAEIDVAAEFEAIHTVERARQVGSLHDVVPSAQMRPYLIGALEEALAGADGERAAPSSARSPLYS